MALLHCPLLIKRKTPFNPRIKCEKDTIEKDTILVMMSSFCLQEEEDEGEFEEAVKQVSFFQCL
jgi:hypothetical protein